MGDPDQSARRRGRHAAKKPGKRERQRQGVGVREVVGDGAGTRPGEVGEHGEVGREEEKRANRP